METITTDVTPAALRNPFVRSFPARLLLIGLLVFVALAIVHRGPLFFQPWHEHSDYAVEALTIERAGEFRQIHGSYSRFGFHHPGPAFYFVNAIGENVLYHWLHWVPSPHNAHLVASLLAQCFFFAAALAMVDQWIRRPLFLPLAILAATIHFGLAENAFISSWQPRVVLMPFLCFLVGAASVAAGQIRHLPLAVLAGCFLVHGHVAQPLFVVPLFLAGYGFACFQARKAPGGIADWLRAHWVAHATSVACIVLFLVPLVIDLRAGPESNLARILEFQLSRNDPGKPLWKSLLYLGGFFGYLKKPGDFFTAFGGNRRELIGERLEAYFIWAVIIAIVLTNLVRIARRRDAAERPFILTLAAFIVLTLVLCLYWGVTQIGRIYEYNGYFYYAILTCILLLFCAEVSAFQVPKPRWVGVLLCTVARMLAWQRQYTPLPIDYSNNSIPPAVRQALNADPAPAAPKYLLFNHGDWGEAVSIGLALKRAHHEFRADADWGPKFAPNGSFEPTPPEFDMRGMSTWRLSRLGPSDIGSPIRDNLRVYFKPLPLDPTTAVIDCRENGNLELYTLFGFASPFRHAAWTIRPHAGLVFDAPPVSSDLSVTFFAEPFASAGESASQPMVLSVNGRNVFTGTLTARSSVTARVPAEAWNAKKPVMMVLHFPSAISPRSLGLSLDERTFGWHIERITFESAR